MEMTIEDIPENNFSQTNKINKQNKKKQIDYDGILKKMGMKESKGKLFWEKNSETSSENFIPYDPGQRRKNINTQQHKSSKNPTYQSPNPAYQSPNPAYQSQAYQNSYIHNKYFKNEFKEQEEMQKPRNLIEYRNMLIRRIIERKRIEQIKSRQMIFK
jgi:hypothetical protein